MKRTEAKGSCPYCYRFIVAVVNYFGEALPMHLDIAICKACGEASMFDFTKRKNILRKPTGQERLAIEKNTSAIRVRMHQHELRHRSHH